MLILSRIMMFKFKCEVREDISMMYKKLLSRMHNESNLSDKR